jgi:hypothetical protein
MNHIAFSLIDNLLSYYITGTKTCSVVFICRIWGYHSGGYEEYLLGHNVVQLVECQPMFRRNMSPPYSGSKNNPRARYQPENRWQADPEDVCDMFLGNVD